MGEEPVQQLAPDGGTISCPRCGAPVPVLDDWCDRCEWNVDPEPDKTPKPRQVRAQRRADRRGEQLYRDLARARESGGRRRYNVARLGSTVMASCVLLLLPLFAAITALIWWRLGLSPLAVIATAVLVPVAVETRPRMGTKPWDAVILERDQAPGLYAFVDELRPLVGTRRPHLLALSGDYNAATMPIGWRQRRLVVIGVPLWDQLGPQERVAVVCHELGHDLHGNIVHGPLVSYSIRTLSTWYRVLATNPGRLKNRSIIPELVLGALGAGVKRLFRLQIRLARRGSPLGEYLADEASARVASSEAALKGMEATLIAPSATQFINFHISAATPTCWVPAASPSPG